MSSPQDTSKGKSAERRRESGCLRDRQMIEYLVQGLVLRRPCDTAQLMLFASPSVLKPKQLLSHSITETVPHEHAEWTKKSKDLAGLLEFPNSYFEPNHSYPSHSCKHTLCSQVYSAGLILSASAVSYQLYQASNSQQPRHGNGNLESLRETGSIVVARESHHFLLFSVLRPVFEKGWFCWNVTRRLALK